VERLFENGGRSVLYRAFLEASFDQLRAAIDWQQEHIRMFGRDHLVPRLVAFYGDVPYRYAGVDHPPRPLPAVVRMVQSVIEPVAGFRFNSVLCNLYRGGGDGMGYHRDNEPEIDTGCIASASFGAARRFKLRHRDSGDVITVDLDHGDLLLMFDCQSEWEHAIPKTRRATGPRINLTYRRVRSRAWPSSPPD
jgi:alkylated DNA repair dioxygenase AlkB